MKERMYMLGDIPEAKLFAGKVKRLALSMTRHGYSLNEALAFIASARGIADQQKPQIAAWFAENLPKLSGDPQYQTICEGCACCLGGQRDAAAKAIYREEPTVAARLGRLLRASVIMGHYCELLDERTFDVHFFPELPYYRCPCLGFEEGRQEVTMPESYCYCCGGHLKHHIGTAVGCEVDVTLLASALTSFGKEGCRFRVRVMEPAAAETPASP